MGEQITSGMSPPSNLRSVHTDTFALWLQQNSVSLAVTTYQAGKVVLLREQEGKVNTHFRGCDRPMGLAVSHGRVAIGGAREIVEFHNMEAAAASLSGEITHDACYLPRKVSITGDIDIHEMGYGTGDELWFVNTRFSCLCTMDDEHSFVPAWRPGFISGLSPQDRCHLNGLAMKDGKPAWATALSATDTASGWRDTKKSGGVLIDIASGDVVVDGLSMPHSPRWHNGKLWLLESGDGSIGTVDLDSGHYEPVGHVPGFARGLTLAGDVAAIGVSQVRESAVFSGIPITERLQERLCGIWLIELTSGKELGFVRFEQDVQEIFAVEILPHRFPEIVETNAELVGQTYAMPAESLADVQWLPPRP